MARANANAASKKFITENEISDGTALSSDRFVSVASIKGTKKKAYAHGYGTRNRQDANAGYSHADLAATDSSGSATAPTGKLRLVIYESTDEERYKAILSEVDLADYREAASDARTEKPVLPISDVGAAEDEVLGWEVKVESGYDGDTLDAANSDVHIPFAQFRTA